MIISAKGHLGSIIQGATKARTNGQQAAAQRRDEIFAFKRECDGLVNSRETKLLFNFYRMSPSNDTVSMSIANKNSTYHCILLHHVVVMYCMYCISLQRVKARALILAQF